MATQQAPSINAARFYEEAQHTMEVLYDRWLEEHEFEDIKDYQKPLDSIAKKHGVRIVAMTKKPFGCTFEVDGRTYRLSMTLRKYEYRRIA